MAASIDIETESGIFSGSATFRDGWGFERSWWAQDDVSESPARCPGDQLQLSDPSRHLG